VNPYRCVIIGCGGRAHEHARAYSLVSRGTLVACCDRHPEKLEPFATKWGLVAYADAAEMIRQEQPDLVHIVTGPRGRVETMALVSEQNVPACIIEKPIAFEVRDWRQIVTLETESATKFGVGAQMRYHNDLTRCREALQSGALGRVLYMDGSAGSTICDQGVHNIDWMMSLNKDSSPTQVFGVASGVENMNHRMHPSPDTTVGQIVFANGIRATWNLGHTAPRVLDAPEAWKHGRIAVYAERGRVLYEEFRNWEIVSPEGVQSGGRADMDEWRQGNAEAQANLTNAMFDWIEDADQPVGTCLARAIEQWNAVLGLYASTITRQPVDLPFEPDDDLWEQLRAVLSKR
jgi:predicted dehydrogenase